MLSTLTNLTIADIAPGEEITCNYSEFEPGFEMMPSMVAAHAARQNGGGSSHAG